MKKLFAILMSIMMIACFMPSMAFADGPETPAADATLEIVPAKVGDDTGHAIRSASLSCERR